LIIATVVLMLVTLIGISATTTSMTEVQVATHERTYRQNFFRGEGAAMLAAQRLQNEKSAKELQNLPYGEVDDNQWLRRDKSDLPDPDHIYNEENWCTEELISDDAIDADSRFFAIYQGIAEGASLGLEQNTALHEYNIYGRGEKNSAAVIIEIGYRKRF